MPKQYLYCEGFFYQEVLLLAFTVMDMDLSIMDFESANPTYQRGIDENIDALTKYSLAKSDHRWVLNFWFYVWFSSVCIVFSTITFQNYREKLDHL